MPWKDLHPSKFWLAVVGIHAHTFSGGKLYGVTLFCQYVFAYDSLGECLINEKDITQ